MNLLYGKILAGLVCVVGIFYAGWHLRDVDFMAYKKEVEHTAKTQEEKVKSVRSQQELVTKGIKDEYDAKLSALRNYYKSTSVWNNNGSSTVPGISTTPKSADVISSYNELASNCAQTTLMLVELQKWINEQVGIK